MGNYIMSMDDREKAYENKFAIDQQTLFKVEARASRLLGLWAAEKMGLAAEAATAYAKEVVVSNLDEPGFDDVKRKLVADFSAADIAVTERTIDEAIQSKIREARAQIDAESKGK